MTQNDEVKKRILEINEFVKELVPEIRSQAYEQLALGIVNASSPVSKAASSAESTEDIASFFAKCNPTKPSDAALAIAAFWYSQYGSAPFTKAWVEDVAARVGLTIPARVDMTFRSARRNSKQLFQVSKQGFAFTVHGELVIQEMYEVKKGTQTPSVGDDE